jgi:hypothetical protein
MFPMAQKPFSSQIIQVLVCYLIIQAGLSNNVHAAPDSTGNPVINIVGRHANPNLSKIEVDTLTRCSTRYIVQEGDTCLRIATSNDMVFDNSILLPPDLHFSLSLSLLLSLLSIYLYLFQFLIESFSFLDSFIRLHSV